MESSQKPQDFLPSSPIAAESPVRAVPFDTYRACEGDPTPIYDQLRGEIAGRLDQLRAEIAERAQQLAPLLVIEP